MTPKIVQIAVVQGHIVGLDWNGDLWERQWRTRQEIGQSTQVWRTFDSAFETEEERVNQ